MRHLYDKIYNEIIIRIIRVVGDFGQLGVEQ